MKTLKNVACGQTVKVTKLTGDGPVKRRIMDMGITKGVDVFVRKGRPDRSHCSWIRAFHQKSRC